MDSNDRSAFYLSTDHAYYCKHCGVPDNGERHGRKCVFNPDRPHPDICNHNVGFCAARDPEPQPSDEPEYHADHAAWLNRKEESRTNMEEAIEIKSEAAPDMVNSPSHYTGPVPGIECIDVTRHFSLLRGTAIKYLWRADYKNNKVEDLKKAIWYIQKELDTLEDW